MDCGKLPGAEEGTPEWDAAAQEYSWFQDWMEEAAEQQYFRGFACQYS